MTAPTPDSFFAQQDVVGDDGAVPRDHNDRPMIQPVDEAQRKEHAYKSGKFKGLIPYARSSSFGSILEDETNLVKWQKRQVARGIMLLFEQGKLATGPEGGAPFWPGNEPAEREEKRAWDAMADRAETAVGSYAKAEIGTAIHSATEAIDRGEDLSGWPDLLRERAEAYWRATREWGFRPVTIEQFGVEDTHRVAGTWDRTAYFRGRHVIGDVKTSSSMDFAGIGFAVQLAEYAHMAAYDPKTGERTPHESMDLEVAWIIHVDRNMHGPVELFRVDIATGWRFAQLVDQVKRARAEGKKAITEVHPDAVEGQIYRAESVAELRSIFNGLGALAEQYAPQFKEMAAWLRLRSA